MLDGGERRHSCAEVLCPQSRASTMFVNVTTSSDIQANLGPIHTPVVFVLPPRQDDLVSAFHVSFMDILTVPGGAPEKIN